MNGAFGNELVEADWWVDRDAVKAGEDALLRCLVHLRPRKPAERPDAKANIHLALVLDVSGSMNAPDKYPRLLEALRILVADLPPTAALSIVLYSDQVDVALKPCVIRALPDLATAIPAAIDASPAKFGQSTLLGPALAQIPALDAEARRRTSAGLTRVFVMTDGQLHDREACEGVLASDIARLETEVRWYGFGSDYDAEVLKALAGKCRGGFFRPVLEGADLPKTFGRWAAGAGKTVTSSTAVEIAVPAAHIAGEILRVRPDEVLMAADNWSEGPEGRVLTLRPGALEAGRDYQYAFRVRIGPAKASRVTVAAVRLDVFGLDSARHRSEGFLEVPVRDAPAQAQLPRPVAGAFYLLDSLVDSEGKLTADSLRARIALYEMEGRDPKMVERMRRALALLEGGKPLTEEFSDLDVQQIVAAIPQTQDERYWRRPKPGAGTP